MIHDFFISYPFFIPILAVFLAELLKVALGSIKKRRLSFDTFLRSGGMPSGHSALVGSLFVLVYLLKGIHSIEFTITAIFSLIVMYDAINIRMEAGKHARILNFLQKKERLSESLGHTFWQVGVGFVFGGGITMGMMIV
jgi:hypothetical protein